MMKILTVLSLLFLSLSEARMDPPKSAVQQVPSTEHLRGGEMISPKKVLQRWQQPKVISGGTASISTEIFNLIKAIVGVGVLSLPAGIAAFGNAPSAVLPALGLMLVIGLLSAYGFALIGKVCAYTGATSYREAWAKSVGSSSSWIPAWSATAKTTLACLAFSMVLADTFSALLRTSERTQVLSTLTIVILLPLCWLKDLASLAPFSLVGVLGMVFTGISMTKRYLDQSYVPGAIVATKVVGDAVQHVYENKPLLEKVVSPVFGNLGWKAAWSPQSLILVCMLSTAYMAHFNAPKFYLELKNNTLPRYYTVVTTSFLASIVLMGAIAAVGFLTFGASSQGLILNNYAANDVWIAGSRVAVAIALVFSYPLAFQGCRDGWLDVFQIKERNNFTLNVTTIALLGALTLAAASLRDVSLVLALGGATLGNALTYVYPALMYGAVNRQQGRKEGGAVAVSYLSALLGVAMGVVGAKMALQK